MKKKIWIVFVVILLVMGVFIFYFMSSKDSPKQSDKVPYTFNENPGIVSPREVEGILFSDIYCKIENGVSMVGYRVTNNNDFDVSINEYNLIFEDSEGNIIKDVVTDIPITVKANTSISTESIINANLEKATKMSLKLKEW